jgi:hypothetical protein
MSRFRLGAIRTSDFVIRETCSRTLVSSLKPFIKTSGANVGWLRGSARTGERDRVSAGTRWLQAGLRPLGGTDPDRRIALKPPFIGLPLVV